MANSGVTSIPTIWIDREDENGDSTVKDRDNTSNIIDTTKAEEYIPGKSIPAQKMMEEKYGKNWQETAPMLEIQALPRDTFETAYEGKVEQEKTFKDSVEQVTRELSELMMKKQHDYGPDNIMKSPYGPIQGLVTRLYDKIARAANLTAKGVDPANESLEDTFKDIANYGIIGLMVLREEFELPFTYDGF